MCDGQPRETAEFGINHRVARRSFPRLSGTFRGTVSAALSALLLISCDDDFMLSGTWKGEAGSYFELDENGWPVDTPSNDDSDEWVLDMERRGPYGVFGTFHAEWLGTEKQGELWGWYHGKSFKSGPTFTLHVGFEHDNVDIECKFVGGAVDDDRIAGSLDCRSESGERSGRLSLDRG